MTRASPTPRFAPVIRISCPRSSCRPPVDPAPSRHRDPGHRQHHAEGTEPDEPGRRGAEEGEVHGQAHRALRHQHREERAGRRDPERLRVRRESSPVMFVPPGEPASHSSFDRATFIVGSLSVVIDLGRNSADAGAGGSNKSDGVTNDRWTPRSPRRRAHFGPAMPWVHSSGSPCGTTPRRWPCAGLRWLSSGICRRPGSSSGGQAAGSGHGRASAGRAASPPRRRSPSLLGTSPPPRGPWRRRCGPSRPMATGRTPPTRASSDPQAASARPGRRGGRSARHAPGGPAAASRRRRGARRLRD